MEKINKYKFFIFSMHFGFFLGMVPGLLMIGALAIDEPGLISLVAWGMGAVLTVWAGAMGALKYKNQPFSKEEPD